MSPATLPKIILVTAVGLIVSGLGLVLIGSNSAMSGGCFLWPLPIIVVCGAGTGSESYLVLAIGLVVVFAISLLSFFSLRGHGSPGQDDSAVE